MLAHEGNAELLRLVSTAVMPWFSLDALTVSQESYYSECQRNIDMCIGCKKQECDNCLSGRTKFASRGRPKNKINFTALKAMIDNGETSKTICSSLRISRRTFFYYKRKISGGIT